MSKHISEPNDELRAEEEVSDDVVDIYEDVPEFDEAPWKNAIIEGVQDDEGEEA